MILAQPTLQAPAFLCLTSDPLQVAVENVGAKAHSLMKLRALGVNVPEGLVLTASALSECGRDIGRIAALVNTLPKVPGARVMVRSSAVGEDGVDTSFAGQLESYQVQNAKADIAGAVLKCLQSMQAERVHTYESKIGKTLDKMGVIVQRMVAPDYAGVYFTAHPSDADLELVEYVQGHCEKLVQGEVTPTSVSLPTEERFPFSIGELQACATKIKDHFQSEQDIEWLVDRGEFFFVQSRPITRLQRRVSWSSTNVNENYPDELSPLLYSVARRSYYHYFKNLGARLGVLRPGEGEAYFANIIGLWGERMYYNMSNVHAVIGMSPVSDLLGKSFDNFVGYQKGKRKGPASVRVWVKLRFAAKTLLHYFRLPTHVRKIERRVQDFAERPIERDTLPALFHEFLDIRFNYWFHASFADFFAMTTHGMLGRFLHRLGLQDATGLQNSLVQSIPNLVSNEPIFALWKIKVLVEDRGESDLFERMQPGELWDRLQADPSLAVIKNALDSYLESWGFRCTGELTFLDENHIENPESFMQLLQMFMRSQVEDPALQFSAKRQEQQQKLKEAKRAIFKKRFALHALPAATLLSALVKSTVVSISARERVRLKQAQMYFHFKKVCLALGESLVEKGVLAERSDVFFLEYDELSRLLNFDEVDGQHWRSMVTLRKAKLDRAEERSENLTSNTYGFDGSYVDQDSGSNTDLVGLPACGGKVTARAVVLSSIHEIDQLQKGDILVTRQTDPGWICAFPLISGLVVERGGMLSHGAIVAREFGVPAVVGVKGVTTVIKTGDLIEVDGNRGAVECKS